MDSIGNFKWSAWYYDSLNNQRILSRGATINSIKETSRGTIICAAGNAYPEFNAPINYAAFLEYDTLGHFKRAREWDNQTGYAIGGYYIEETATRYYMLSGNQATFYLDSVGTPLWKKKYTFSMPTVGTVTNNVARVKMLRDGSLMVAGQSYESNCFQLWGAYYYDAWWSPISYSFGTDAVRDTAGKQKATDRLFDYVQLVSGNLVFVGSNGTQNSGLWTYVTDSTGAQLLWEGQFKQTDSIGTFSNSTAISVCATPDSGFTIGGYYNRGLVQGDNALAVHFIPKDPAVAQKNFNRRNQRVSIVKTTVNSSQVVINIAEKLNSLRTIEIFGAGGKQVARLAVVESSMGLIATWNVAGISKGVYMYKVTKNKESYCGNFVIH